jgi:CheY-like chemotaxis protein
VSVCDQGTGLTPEQRARLFQPFDRLGAERSGTEGSGLGLLIARELVEAMGGTLEVKSEPGRGSVFAVLLPRYQSTDTAALPPATPAVLEMPKPRTDNSPLREVTLLYIEDEPVNAILVQEALRHRPHWKLTLAADGNAGLALARALRPAIVLSDINLPGLSGLDVVRELRSDPLGSGLICIALSADAMPHQIETAMDAGFNDYWTKPLDLASIPARIEHWLQAATARQRPGAVS